MKRFAEFYYSEAVCVARLVFWMVMVVVVILVSTTPLVGVLTATAALILALAAVADLSKVQPR